jgi:hypothetical protein
LLAEFQQEGHTMKLAPTIEALVVAIVIGMMIIGLGCLVDCIGVAYVWV